jgi:DNA-directed RNA polymerase specialized sigma24 family protein
MSTPSLIHSVQPLADESALARNELELSLVYRARNGDRTALKGLWDEYHGPIHQYFARAIASREEAEDLTSETLLAVFHNIRTFRGIASDSTTTTAECTPANDTNSLQQKAPIGCTFSSFVFSIAKNQLRQWLRRKHVRDQRTLAASYASHPADSQDGVSAEWRAADATADPLFSLLRREHLDSACYALAGVGIRSCEQFKALLFHYACGLAHKEVASLLNTRKETINARLQEGRVTLKAHYAGPLKS